MTRLNIFLLLLIVTLPSFGQYDTSAFIVTVGDFVCKPRYTRQHIDTNTRIRTISILSEDTEAFLSTLLPVEPETELNIYFTSRPDTTVRRFPDGHIEKVIRQINHHSYANVHDSICEKDVKKLMTGKIIVLNKNRIQKIKKYSIQLLFQDGNIIRQDMHSSLVKLDKKIYDLATQNKLVYIGIYEIELVDDLKKTLYISTGYGWKILNCH